MLSSAKAIRSGALLAAASLVLAACSQPAASARPSSAAATQGASQAPGASASAATGELPAPEKTDVKIGVSVTEPSQYAAILAKQLGIYEKNGLNVEYSVFEGDARVADALQSGQIDFGLSGTSSALSSQLTDVPYDAVSVLAIVLTDDLVCQSAIKTAEHLKADPADGQPATIAISTFGGTSNAAALLALKSLNLAATDAVITQVGGQSARLAALQGGSIDCAIIDSNMQEDMIAQGFSIVAKLKEANIEYGRSGMAATEDFLAANPNTTLVVVASLLEAQNVIFENTEEAVPHYVEFTENTEEDARALLEDFTEIGNRDLMWSDEAFRNPQKAIAIINPDIIDIEVTEAFNRSFVDKLVEIGYYDKLGVPIEN